MAKHETLKAEKREVKGTTASKRLRRGGIVPGVIYGSSQREYMIQMDSKSFFDIAKKQASHNFLVDIEIDGADEKSKLAIVQDIQRDPLNGKLIHIDFRAVSENESIQATVPIHLLGESKGVKNGGILEQLLHEIEVTCRPNDLPDAIENHIDDLDMGDSIKVSELNLPDGVSVRMDGDVLVGNVAQPRLATAAEEEAEAAAAEAAPAEGGEAAAEGGDSAE